MKDLQLKKKILNGWLGLLILIPWIVLAGCEATNQGVANQSSSQEAKDFFKKIEQLSDSSKLTEMENLLHNEWDRLGKVSDTLLFRKYEFLSKLYQSSRSKMDVSLKYADTLEALLDGKEGFLNFKLHVAYTKGSIAMLQQNYQAAVNYFYRGRQILNFREDPCNAFTYLTSLAQIQYNFGNHRVAADYLVQALDYGQICQDVIEEKNLFAFLMIKNDIAINYERLGIMDSAVYFLEAVLADLAKVNLDTLQGANRAYRIKGVVLGNLGGVLLKEKKYTTSEQYLRESIRINDMSTREPGDALFTKIKLGRLLLETNRVEECNTLMDEMSQSKWLNTLPEARRRYFNLAYRYHKTTNNTAALGYRDKEIELADSLQHARAWSSFLPDFNREFDNLENKIGMLELARKQTQQWLFIALLGTLMVISIFLAYYYFSKRRKQAEHIQQLSQLNSQISDANEQLTLNLNLLEASLVENNKLMRVLAHDLRSPIASMLQIAHLMQDANTTAEEHTQYLELLHTSGHTALKLMDDILVSRQQGALDLAEVNLAELLQLAVRLQQPQADKKSIAIELAASDLVVKADKQKLLRVVLNLIANAIKFSYRGGTVRVELERQDVWARITVTDFGTGIPESIRPYLFSFLTEGGLKGTEGERTHGMGLAIAAQVIQGHHGKLRYQSEVGKGTVFFVELPLA